MITNLLLAPQIPLIAATVLYPYEMAFNIIENCVTNRCKIHESSESASLAPWHINTEYTSHDSKNQSTRLFS